MNLGYRGADFTWCNMQEGENRIQLRLDRAFANTKWVGKFDGTRVYHLVDLTSDHCALLLTNSPPPPPNAYPTLNASTLKPYGQRMRNAGTL